RERPRAEQEVLERHRELAVPAARAAVQRASVADLVDAANLEMVVQVLADARQVVHDGDATLGEQRARADARQLQQLRRADRSGRKHDLAARRDALRLAGRRAAARAGAPLAADEPRLGAEAHVDGARTPHAVALLDDDALDERVRRDGQVRPRERRAQEGLRRAPAHAAALVHLKVRRAGIVAAIEFVDLGYAALGRRFAPCVEYRPAHAALLDAQLAARAVILVGAVL